MRKINYRITVNITQKTMKLGFRAKMPDEMQGKRIRVQAVFTQRQVERRFPMKVVIEEVENYDFIIMGDLKYAAMLEKITGKLGIRLLEAIKKPIFIG